MKTKYKPMLCPVCKKFYFSELIESDMFPPQCNHCGWIYDFSQIMDPDVQGGPNIVSLKQYRIDYKEKKQKNPNYDYTDNQCHSISHLCPVCGKYRFTEKDSFDICPYCGWEDDGVMEEDPKDWAGCSNDLCLVDFRKRYEKLITINPSYKYEKDGFPK